MNYYILEWFYWLNEYNEEFGVLVLGEEVDLVPLWPELPLLLFDIGYCRYMCRKCFNRFINLKPGLQNRIRGYLMFHQWSSRGSQANRLICSKINVSSHIPNCSLLLEILHVAVQDVELLSQAAQCSALFKLLMLWFICLLACLFTINILPECGNICQCWTSDGFIQLFSGVHNLT